MNFHDPDLCEPPPSAVSQPPLTRWIGDDWKFPIQYLQSTGAKFDLTGHTAGATLYVRGSSTPINIAGVNGQVSIVTPLTGGNILVVVNSSVTSTVPPDPSFADVGPTRLQVWIVDPTSLRTTIAVFPIFVRLL